MKDSQRLYAITQRIQVLDFLDERRSVFCAEHHKYESFPITDKKIAQFEEKNGILIPNQLRTFWLEIGWGAGPDYGIYGLSGSLSTFESWSEQFGETIPGLAAECELTEEIARELIDKKKEKPEGFFCTTLNTVNGILPIQTEGCNRYAFIVLNGELRGQIWRLNAYNFECHPIGLTETETFFDWYESWLNKQIGLLQPKTVNSKVESANKQSPESAKWKSWYKRVFNTD